MNTQLVSSQNTEEVMVHKKVEMPEGIALKNCGREE